MRKKREDSMLFSNGCMFTSEEGVRLKSVGSVGRSFEEYSKECKLKS